MVTSGRGGRGKICRKRWRATKQIHFEELVVVVVVGGVNMKRVGEMEDVGKLQGGAERV